MFSGIVETTGNLVNIALKQGCKYFTIAPHQELHDLIIGESICVNGACLTVTDFSATSFNVTAVPETLRLTNLGQLDLNAPVNLERSLKLNSRIGGHYMQGHVDTKGQILELNNDNQSEALLVKISLPQQFAKYVIAKGFIGIDGMSITVIKAAPAWFTVTLIPHTQAVTISNNYRKGTWVNIEIDMISKYVEKLLGAYTHASID